MDDVVGVFTGGTTFGGPRMEGLDREYWMGQWYEGLHDTPLGAAVRFSFSSDPGFTFTVTPLAGKFAADVKYAVYVRLKSEGNSLHASTLFSEFQKGGAA